MRRRWSPAPDALLPIFRDELLPANPALRLGKYLRVADEPEPDIEPFTRDEARHLLEAFNRLLDAAELDRRGPHQVRHTFASLLLQQGAPITYVSRQLGHKDPSITLSVYAHWLPDNSMDKLVDVLDDTAPRGPQTAPTTSDAKVQKAVRGVESVVSRVGIEPTTRRLRVCCSAN